MAEVEKLIDLFAPSIRRNPYPTYAHLRAERVSRVEPGGLFTLSRYDDVAMALKSTSSFSSRGFQALLRPNWLPENPIADSLLTKDPPEHGILRALVSKWFSPRTVAALEARVRKTAESILSDLVEKGEGDFAEDFAIPFPAKIICEILGLDSGLHREFRRWAQTLALISPIPLPADVQDMVKNTVQEMDHYLRSATVARRKQPKEDLLSALVQSTVDNRTLTDDEIVSFLFILLPAGFDTTSNLILNAMMSFCEYPELFRGLQNEEVPTTQYLDELIRYNPPVHGVVRFSTNDVTIGDKTIPKNSMVLLLIGAANHDEAHFEHPELFRCGQKGSPPLSFGHGAHHCLGATLARLEGRIAVETLRAKFRMFQLLVPKDELVWNRNLTVRGPEVLPVRYIQR